MILVEARPLGTISTTAKTVDASITPDIDVNMYRFTVAAGQVVDFDIDTTLNGPGGLGSYLRLFNAQGQQLAFNNDAVAPGENVLGFDAYLRYTFATAGTYYIGVSNANNTQYNPITGNGDTAGGQYSIGDYQLIVQTAPVTPDGPRRFPLRSDFARRISTTATDGRRQYHSRHRRRHVSLHGDRWPSRRFRYRYHAQRSWRLGSYLRLFNRRASNWPSTTMRWLPARTRSVLTRTCVTPLPRRAPTTSACRISNNTQ